MLKDSSSHILAMHCLRTWRAIEFFATRWSNRVNPWMLKSQCWIWIHLLCSLKLLSFSSWALRLNYGWISQTWYCTKAADVPTFPLLSFLICQLSNKDSTDLEETTKQSLGNPEWACEHRARNTHFVLWHEWKIAFWVRSLRIWG